MTMASGSLTHDMTKTEELIATLWRFAAEGKRPKGKQKSRDRRRGRPLVQPNEFALVCTVGTATTTTTTTRCQGEKRKEKSNAVAKRRILRLTSWKMNEYEYAKGSLPTLARGLFTYSEHDPCEDDLDDDYEEGSGDFQKPGKAGSGQEATGDDDLDDEEGDGENEEAGKIDLEERSKNGRILIRGYNKFFNLEEVNESKLSWIREHSRAPYEVTLKENGCIIFMAGMPPGYFDEGDPSAGCIVSSKHFLGSLGDKTGKAGTVAHSDKGREWLDKCLKAKGKTMLEFGRWLWKHRITAVAELCDDSFEEHVLEYSPERSGLYLHGLNCNTPDFKTWPSEDVYKAAAEWGFHPTQYVTLNTVDEVMAFTNKVRDDGEYDHRPIEGFVVRCKVSMEDEGGVTKERDHFFKIKYDEPYLMYREWREITKHLWTRQQREEKEKEKTQKKRNKGLPHVDTKEGASTTSTTAVDSWLRMKYPLTKAYVDFVTSLMSEKPDLFVNYNKNQGIIAIRDMFLHHWEKLSQAKRDALQGTVSSSPNAGTEGASSSQGDFDRTLIVPIATIGCGKTTVSVALAELFGWAHVSSDDFNHFAKNSGARFMKEVVHQLCTNEVVIADRNNHLFLHRERLFQTVRETWPKTRFVALYWSREGKSAFQVIEEAAERVRRRGKNHQVMTPEFCVDYMDVIQQFARSFQPLNPLIAPDSEFHQVIEVKVGDDTRSIVQKVIDELVGRVKGANALPKPEKIDKAVQFAIEEWAPHRVTSGEAARHHQQIMKKAQQKEKQLAAVKEADIGSIDSSSITATSATKKKKLKEPKYFGIVLSTRAVTQFLQDEFGITFSKVENANVDGKGGDIAERSASQSLISTTSRAPSTHSEKEGDRKVDWQACRERLQEWAKLGRLKSEYHVTLIHSSILKTSDEAQRQRGTQIWKQYTDEVAAANSSSTVHSSIPMQASSLDEAMSSLSLSDSRAVSSPTTSLHAELEVDALVWTDRLIAMPIRHLYRVLPDGQQGQPYETTQKMLHVTVALRDGSVHAVESNAVLDEWKQRLKRNGGSAVKTKEGEQAIWSYKPDKPYKLQGHLMGLAW